MSLPAQEAEAQGILKERAVRVGRPSCLLYFSPQLSAGLFGNDLPQSIGSGNSSN